MLSVVAALLPVVTYEAEASSYTMQTTAIYTDETCSGPAVNILVIDNDNCSAMACSPQPSGNSNFYKATTCYSTDSLSYNPMEDLFLGQTFIEIQAYSNINCTDDAYLYRHGLIVGSCEPFSTRNNHSVSVTLESDGSATILLYNNTECTDPLVTTYALSNYTLVNHHCYEGISSTELAQYTARYYVHLDYDSAGESEADSNFAAIVGETEEDNSTERGIGSDGGIMHRARDGIPQTWQLNYNTRYDAARRTRGSSPRVNTFRAEVKVAAVKDHPHIIKFISVAGTQGSLFRHGDHRRRRLDNDTGDIRRAASPRGFLSC